MVRNGEIGKSRKRLLTPFRHSAANYAVKLLPGRKVASDETQEAIAIAMENVFGQQIEFLQRLVRARSSNPILPNSSPPDVPVEEEVAAVIQQELHRLGLPAELVGISSQRPNVVCHIPGSGKTGKTLILTTHMDTVEPSDYTRDPWGAHIEEGRLYGVGAADAKAQIAAFVYAAYALRQAGISLAGGVTLAFVVDEEPGACSPYGTRYLLSRGCCKETLPSLGSLEIIRSLSGIAASIVFACRFKVKQPIPVSKHGSRGGEGAMPSSTWRV